MRSTVFQAPACARDPVFSGSLRAAASTARARDRHPAAFQLACASAIRFLDVPIASRAAAEIRSVSAPTPTVIQSTARRAYPASHRRALFTAPHAQEQGVAFDDQRYCQGRHEMRSAIRPRQDIIHTEQVAEPCSPKVVPQLNYTRPGVVHLETQRRKV